MTISKEKFESIICDEATKVSSDGWLCGDDPVIEFAYALIKRVEAESEVVAWGIEKEEQFFFGKKDKRPFAKAWKPYAALPLVEGD